MPYLSKGPWTDCAVKLFSDHCFAFTMKKEAGRGCSLREE